MIMPIVSSSIMIIGCITSYHGSRPGQNILCLKENDVHSDINRLSINVSLNINTFFNGIIIDTNILNIVCMPLKKLVNTHFRTSSARRSCTTPASTARSRRLILNNYVYIYIYIHLSLSLSLSLPICIYIYIHTYVYIYML